MKDSEKVFFHKWLKEIKLEDKDFFNFGREGYRVRKTILNSDKACLKRCEELLAQMDQKGQAQFVDPDFGPQTRDDLA